MNDDILLNNLFRSTPDHIYFKDRSSRFLRITPSMAQWLRIGSPEEAIGKTDFDFFTEEHASVAFEEEQKILLTGNPLIGIEEKETWPDGTYTWVTTTKLPLRNEEGEIVGIFGISRDITQQKDTQNELMKARESADKANRAKSEFLANMSHEIRTPMNGVIGMAGLLLDTKLNDEQKEFVEIIRESGDNLLTLINEILDFSKIESGMLDLEHVDFDLVRCLDGVLDVFKAQSAAKGIKMSYHCDSATPRGIVSDPTRLRQVLINLVGNGLKFTEKGEVTVKVVTENLSGLPPDCDYLRALDEIQLPNEKWVRLTFEVQDTGSGIPDEHLDRLFRAFSQADHSITRRHGGTGLGLVIAKRVVETMGGEIWVKSIPGEGTSFFFTVFTKETQSRPHIDSTGAFPQLANRHILIVDAAELNRRILNLQVEKWKMVSHHFERPDEALKWLEGKPKLDLAVLGLQMPNSNGLDLAREIRNLKGYEKLPLILLSSSASLIDGSPDYGEMFVARLMKPIRQKDLLDAFMAGLEGTTTITKSLRNYRTTLTDPSIDALSSSKILVVEDNINNQKVFRGILGRLGCTADLASNGKEAIEAVQRERYDIVFMDVQMPVMDGLTATREICSRFEKGDRPYIVALTANAMKEDRDRCYQAGMDEYVSKPIRVDQIKNILERAKANLALIPSRPAG